MYLWKSIISQAIVSKPPPHVYWSWTDHTEPRKRLFCEVLKLNTQQYNFLDDDLQCTGEEFIFWNSFKIIVTVNSKRQRQDDGDEFQEMILISSGCKLSPMSPSVHLFYAFAYYVSLRHVRLALTIPRSFCVTTTTTMPHRQYREDYLYSLCDFSWKESLATFRINYTQFHNSLCRAVQRYYICASWDRKWHHAMC